MALIAGTDFELFQVRLLPFVPLSLMCIEVYRENKNTKYGDKKVVPVIEMSNSDPNMDAIVASIDDGQDEVSDNQQRREQDV